VAVVDARAVLIAADVVALVEGVALVAVVETVDTTVVIGGAVVD
jgi:hypothetical protein